MKPSDEQLINAYVDGELSPETQAQVLERSRHDPAFARQLCEHSRLKQQLRIAYPVPSDNRTGSPGRFGRNPGTWAAALAMLVVGALAGWTANTPSPPGNERLVILDPTGRGQTPATAEYAETRIVFHLNSPDQNTAGELLAEVETMLLAYQEQHRLLRVEIVSHGEGLAVLRHGLSKHKGHVSRLAREFENLTFVACLNTMQRMRVEQGIEVQLLPEVEVTRSGVSHVVKRQREGWSYIRV